MNTIPPILESGGEVGEGTLVSIIIPFKDKPELLYACVDSILQKTTYRSFEIILVSNNSSDEVVANVRDRYSTQDTIQLYVYNIPFNYAAINNWAVSHTVGTYIVFLNNDTELISPNWLESLLSYAKLTEVGAVGVRLYYPDDTIQHAGIHIDPSHEVVHTALGWTKEEMRTSGIDIGVRECSAVTAACLMIKKNVFIDAGMFDEKRFPVDYNDVDLCFRLRSIGYRIMYIPSVELYHYESISRGKWSQMTLAQRQTSHIAKHMMWRLWPEYLSEPDPFIECRL
jgi:GT2 family glycosyltransferase